MTEFEIFKKKIQQISQEIYELNVISTGITSTVYFEPFSLKLADEMYEHSRHPELYEFFEFSPPKNKNETKKYCKKLLERTKPVDNYPRALYWGIRLHENRKFIGTCGLVDIDFTRKSCEWGYGISPTFWGKGYILEVQKILKHIVFNDLKLNRLGGITFTKNKRTINSVLAAGMKKEGIRREYFQLSDGAHDAFLYGMTKSDYLSEVETNREKEPKVDDKLIGRVIEIVAHHIPNEQIDRNSTNKTLAGWDSITHFEIMLTLIEEFNAELTPNDISKCISIFEIASILSTKKLES